MDWDSEAFATIVEACNDTLNSLKLIEGCLLVLRNTPTGVDLVAMVGRMTSYVEDIRTEQLRIKALL